MTQETFQIAQKRKAFTEAFYAELLDEIHYG